MTIDERIEERIRFFQQDIIKLIHFFADKNVTCLRQLVKLRKEIEKIAALPAATKKHAGIDYELMIKQFAEKASSRFLLESKELQSCIFGSGV